jgi:gas vesicle protein
MNTNQHNLINIQMENSNSTAKMVGGIVLGAAIGGALGVLFAPNKGSRTRRQILDKGEDLSEILKDKLDDLFDEVKAEIRSIKHNAMASIESEMKAAETKNIK